MGYIAKGGIDNVAVIRRSEDKDILEIVSGRRESEVVGRFARENAKQRR